MTVSRHPNAKFSCRSLSCLSIANHEHRHATLQRRSRQLNEPGKAAGRAAPLIRAHVATVELAVAELDRGQGWIKPGLALYKLNQAARPSRSRMAWRPAVTLSPRGAGLGQSLSGPSLARVRGPLSATLPPSLCCASTAPRKDEGE